ncbi:thermonuclease family protein [Acetivibrio cellulolyticus]|uniref:thermonuclease family protein n=1 Tax=Acetivibrio cellulolyticus TaxID=35830 RepID=UPI0001E30524|nr:thermonuclease family protein [Acetivibrio cellulolyticus]
MKIKLFILVIIITLISACSNIVPQVKENSQVETKRYDKTENQITRTGSPEEEISDNNLVKATVTRHVDGDTVYVKIAGKSYKMRMIGINCPEYTKEIEPYGKESSEYTKSQLLGKTVYLETDVSNTDKYDRLLRYIWLEIPTETSEHEIRTKMFNAQLVLNGYAHAGNYPPDVKYTDYLKKFQQEAKNKKVGIWGLEKK